MYYSKAQLQKTLSDSNPKYLFFWGHQPSLDGHITASCLSQWWAGHPFQEDQHTYLTAEHYMMAGKARLFDDGEILEQILQSGSPGEAKALGRKVRNFDQEFWKTHCSEIVVQGNFLKFSQHPELSAFLLATYPRVLVEASPVDAIWGIGLAKDDRRVHDPFNWKGENLLGFCLMEARDRLMERSSSST
ncbi:MAG: NADAR family protein [Bacteroidota bacterium]